MSGAAGAACVANWLLLEADSPNVAMLGDC